MGLGNSAAFHYAVDSAIAKKAYLDGCSKAALDDRLAFVEKQIKRLTDRADMEDVVGKHLEALERAKR